LELNETHRTWKEKLEVVSKIVLEYKMRPGFTSDGLALLSAYLYFINTHQIKCAENGTHFRPNHHAELSYQLY
jgi:phosphoglucan,water dikinase